MDRTLKEMNKLARRTYEYYECAMPSYESLKGDFDDISLDKGRLQAFLVDCRSLSSKRCAILNSEDKKTLNEFYKLYSLIVSDLVMLNTKIIYKADGTEEINKVLAESICLKNEAFAILDKVEGDETVQNRANIIECLIPSFDSFRNTQVERELCEEGIRLRSIDAACRLARLALEKDCPDIDEALSYAELADDFYKNETDTAHYLNAATLLLCFKRIYDACFEIEKWQEAVSIAERMVEFATDDAACGRKTNIVDPCTKLLSKAKAKLEEQKIENGEYSFPFFDDPRLIKMLTNEEKKYIHTSETVYSYLASSNEQLDYSAAVIPVMKALESLFYRVLVTCYFPFVKQKLDCGSTSLVHVPEMFKFRDRRGEHLRKQELVHLEIGSALYCMANLSSKDDNEYVPQTLFVEFLKTNGIINYSAVVQTIAQRLEFIRKKRNKAAHRFETGKNDAEECREYLLTNYKFIEYLLRELSFCFRAI